MDIENQMRRAGQTLAEAQGVEKQLAARQKALAESKAAEALAAELKALTVGDEWRTSSEASEAGIPMASAVRASATARSRLDRSGAASAAAPTFAENLSEVRGHFARLEGVVESADEAPTLTAQTLTNQAAQTLDKLVAAWTAAKTTKRPALNQQLQSAGEPAIEIAAPTSAPRPKPGKQPENKRGSRARQRRTAAMRMRSALASHHFERPLQGCRSHSAP